MPHGERPPSAETEVGVRRRLALARTLAWALLVAGWLTLGTLGRQHLPLHAGGLLPLAGWLVMLGAALALAAPVAWSQRRVQGLLATGLLAGALGATQLVRQPAAGLALLASGWALALVGASLTVRRLRAGLHHCAPPVGPALAGAALAWAAWWAPQAAGPSSLGRALQAPVDAPVLFAAVAAQPGGGAVLLAALATLALGLGLARAGAPVAACRAGLFDCALALGALRDWRHPARWPAAVAALAMLPMMATLAGLDEACSSLGLPPGTAAALHLLAMLLPAWLLQGAPAGGRRLPALRSALLPLSALALLLWPGQLGLMAAALLQGAAWSLAWAARWQPVAGHSTRVDGAAAAGAPPAASSAHRVTRGLQQAAPAWLAAAAVLVIGQAWSQQGPAALAGLHALLAGAGGLAALGAALVAAAGARRPAARPPQAAHSAG